MLHWVEEFGVRFPSFQWTPEITWTANHSVSDECDQIDGYIEVHGRHRTLDLWSTLHPLTDDLRNDYPDIHERASVVWERGEVLCQSLWPHGDSGIPSLIIPGEFITPQLLEEALRRFRP